MPAAASHVWSWFVELDATRSGIPAPSLSFSEIANWSRLRGIALRDWEIDALRRLDRIRVAQINGIEEVAEKPAPAMTPQLFRAMFGAHKRA